MGWSFTWFEGGSRLSASALLRLGKPGNANNQNHARENSDSSFHHSDLTSGVVGRL